MKILLFVILITSSTLLRSSLRPPLREHSTHFKHELEYFKHELEQKRKESIENRLHSPENVEAENNQNKPAAIEEKSWFSSTAYVPYIFALGVATPFTITTRNVLAQAGLSGVTLSLWEYKIQSPENSKTNNMRSFAFWYGTGLAVGVVGQICLVPIILAWFVKDTPP